MDATNAAKRAIYPHDTASTASLNFHDGLSGPHGSFTERIFYLRVCEFRARSPTFYYRTITEPAKITLTASAEWAISVDVADDSLVGLGVPRASSTTFKFSFPEAVIIVSRYHRTVAGLNPHVLYDGETAYFEWHEAGHMRMVPIKEVLLDSIESLEFTTGCDGVETDKFEVWPMTLERYRRYVRHKTIGKPNFRTMDELLTAMRREW